MKKKKIIQTKDFSLQITSMADIFMILLVFLLKSFATEASSYTPANGIQIPTGTSKKPVPNAMTVEVLRSTISVDGIVITHLNDFLFDPQDIEQGGSSRTLTSIFLKMIKKNTDSKKILIIADKLTPASSMKHILASASSGGFEDFKFVIEQEK